MASRSGNYKSNKRQKEIKRKKKQEEKISRRQHDANTPAEDSGSTDQPKIDPDTSN